MPIILLTEFNYSTQVKNYINTQVSKATNITDLFNYSDGTIDTKSNDFKTTLLSLNYLNIDTDGHNGGGLIKFDRQPGENDTYIDFSPHGQCRIGVSTSEKIYIVNGGQELTLPTTDGTIALTSDIPSLSGYLLSTTAESTYAKKTDLNSYLTTSSASSTYATKSQLNSYLTTSSASGTYLTKTDASNTYLTKTGASGTYLSQTDAQSTYLTQSSASTTYAKLRAENTFTKQQTIKTDGGMPADMSAGDGILSLQNTFNNTTTTLEVQPSWPPKMTGTRKTASTSLQTYDYTFPSKTGTLATTADIPSVPSLTNYMKINSFYGETSSNFGGTIHLTDGNNRRLFIETDTINPTATGTSIWNNYTITLDHSAPSNRYSVVVNQSFSSYGTAVCKTSNRSTSNFTLFAYNVENNNPSGSWDRQYQFILVDITN